MLLYNNATAAKT